jgi:hypothetical protein
VFSQIHLVQWRETAVPWTYGLFLMVFTLAGRRLVDRGVVSLRAAQIAGVFLVMFAGKHIQTPVVEDLQAAQLDIRLLHIDPVAADRTANALNRLVNRELSQQHSHGGKVAAHETFGHFAHVRGTSESKAAYIRRGLDLVRTI